MRTTIQVNRRGVITLPKELREKLGIEDGGLVMVEESPQGLYLRPAVAYPVEMYTDERVAEFDKEDAELDQYLAAKGRK
jgi:AbrB family looped-hinge helix DNA binding protein